MALDLSRTEPQHIRDRGSPVSYSDPAASRSSPASTTRPAVRSKALHVLFIPRPALLDEERFTPTVPAKPHHLRRGLGAFVAPHVIRRATRRHQPCEAFERIVARPFPPPVWRCRLKWLGDTSPSRRRRRGPTSGPKQDVPLDVRTTTPLRVRMDAGIAMDPRDDPNHATEASVAERTDR